MGIKFLNGLLPFLSVLFSINNVYRVSGGEVCTKKENGRFVQEYCEYGCCGSGTSEYCCTISTSVLVVASVVSGLVLIALITAIVICCYRNYKDKQASRVRRLRQQEQMNAPRVPRAEPPKPPSYISSPPAYSEEMPESHFRPGTVSGNISYNQRFRGTTPGPRRQGQGSVRYTNASGGYPMINGNSHIPGAVEGEAPPPYTEFARGHTPAHRRRRFIRTPVLESTDDINEQDEVNNNLDGNTEFLTEIAQVTQVTETPTRTQQSRAQETHSQSSRTETRVTNSRALESRAVTSRVQESRADFVRENESRAETVARVLRSSRMPRIPTREQEAQSRQLSDVSSRAPSMSTREDSVTSTNISTANPSTPLRRNQVFVHELAAV